MCKCQLYFLVVQSESTRVQLQEFIVKRTKSSGSMMHYSQAGVVKRPQAVIRASQITFSLYLVKKSKRTRKLTRQKRVKKAVSNSVRRVTRNPIQQKGMDFYPICQSKSKWSMLTSSKVANSFC